RRPRPRAPAAWPRRRLARRRGDSARRSAPHLDAEPALVVTARAEPLGVEAHLRLPPALAEMVRRPRHEDGRARARDRDRLRLNLQHGPAARVEQPAHLQRQAVVAAELAPALGAAVDPEPEA